MSIIIQASRHLLSAALLASAGAGALAPFPVPAEEVYFDTISTARASRNHGAYIGVFGGATHTADASFNGRLSEGGLSTNDDVGFFAGIEFGYSFWTPIALRPALELELEYLSSSLNADGPDGARFRSDLRSGLVMLNGIIALDLGDYRSDVGDFWASFHPYIGAGLGGAYTRVSDISLRAAGGDDRSRGSSSDWVFAYQFFGGLEYDLTDTVSIYAEYKRLIFDELGGRAVSNADFDLWTFGVKVEY